MRAMIRNSVLYAVGNTFNGIRPININYNMDRLLRPAGVKAVIIGQTRPCGQLRCFTGGFEHRRFNGLVSSQQEHHTMATGFWRCQSLHVGYGLKIKPSVS